MKWMGAFQKDFHAALGEIGSVTDELDETDPICAANVVLLAPAGTVTVAGTVTW